MSTDRPQTDIEALLAEWADERLYDGRVDDYVRRLAAAIRQLCQERDRNYHGWMTALDVQGRVVVERDKLQAANAALREALKPFVDGMHSITCARMDDWPDEDATKPCTCGIAAAERALASSGDADP
jgi:hypothetical protein